MSCPTCDHTMEGIDRGSYWCPRCGTLRMLVRAGDVVVHTTDQQPKLVATCRFLCEAQVTAAKTVGADIVERLMTRLAEQCLLPAERPGPKS